MDTYNKYLAENVLTEDKVVTYRLLSRALQVHVNTAKQMLYEFHRSQNARRPGAVHATYLVYGTKNDADGTSTAQNGDGDIEMTSSAPEVESPADIVPTFSLSLVPEEQLKDALAEYEEVSSIHVYSIGPHPSKDMALLADAANEALTLGTGNDEKISATITNPRVRRRERQGAGLKAAAAAAVKAKPLAKPVPSKAAQVLTSATAKEEPKPAQEAAEKTTSSIPAKKPAPAPKRGATSGIMQAFSKVAAKPKKETVTSKPATPSGGEDTPMQAMSDDGEDDSEMPQPKPHQASGSKSRKQREEELRRMMEEDDEEEEASEKEETPVEEPMEEEPPAPEPEPAKEEETEVVTASSNGRRRGKRRVMRKKQIMDDQGYLVTIQEPGWESFSEDEAPPPTKVKTASSAPATQVAKPKKGGQKGGQGSIMSFFSKK